MAEPACGYVSLVVVYFVHILKDLNIVVVALQKKKKGKERNEYGSCWPNMISQVRCFCL